MLCQGLAWWVPVQDTGVAPTCRASHPSVLSPAGAHFVLPTPQVKGATAHYDAVVGATTSGVLNAAIDTGVPVVFNVLTCDSMDQVGAPVVKGAHVHQQAVTTGPHPHPHKHSL